MARTFELASGNVVTLTRDILDGVKCHSYAVTIGEQFIGRAYKEWRGGWELHAGNVPSSGIRCTTLFEVAFAADVTFRYHPAQFETVKDPESYCPCGGMWHCFCSDFPHGPKNPALCRSWHCGNDAAPDSAWCQDCKLDELPAPYADPSNDPRDYAWSGTCLTCGKSNQSINAFDECRACVADELAALERNRAFSQDSPAQVAADLREEIDTEDSAYLESFENPVFAPTRELPIKPLCECRCIPCDGECKFAPTITATNYYGLLFQRDSEPISDDSIGNWRTVNAPYWNAHELHLCLAAYDGFRLGTAPASPYMLPAYAGDTVGDPSRPFDPVRVSRMVRNSGRVWNLQGEPMA